MPFAFAPLLPHTAAALHLRSLSPDSAVLLATVGGCLIFLECNRPGWILPGAFGVLLVLLAIPALLPGSHPAWAVVLLGLSLMVCALHLRLAFPPWLSAAAVLALIAAIHSVEGTHASDRVSWALATGCGGTLGLLSVVLARIALRARRAKQVNPGSR